MGGVDMKPKISVVVPVYNPSSAFNECLDSIASACQDLCSQVEVLVIDDYSNESIENIVRPYGFRLERMRQHSGAGATRNFGAALAVGDILLFIDCDVIVPRDSLRKVLCYFDTDPRLTALSARPAIDNGGTGFFNAYKCIFSYNLFHRTQKDVCYLWTSFAAVRADPFRKVGEFSTNYKYAGWEDLELGLRLASIGCKIINSDRIEVIHRHFHNFRSLIKNDWKRAADYMKLLVHQHGIIRRIRSGGQSLQHHEKFALPLSVLLGAVLLFGIVSVSASIFHQIGVVCLAITPFLALMLILSLMGSLALAWRTYGPLFSTKCLLTSFVLSILQSLAALVGFVGYLFNRSAGQRGNA